MDAHALLSAQGWRGTGHSLHKTNDSIGLAKPLLLNRKDNTRGIGATQHFTSDQWWMNAFDEQLQGLDTSKQGKVVQTVTAGKLNSLERASLGKYSLYASFVRGGLLEGTLNGQAADTSSSGSENDTTASAHVSNNTAQPEETKEERRARKEGKRRRKEERARIRLARKQKKTRRSERQENNEDGQRRRRNKEEKRRQK